MKRVTIETEKRSNNAASKEDSLFTVVVNALRGQGLTDEEIKLGIELSLTKNK